ncbi:hypothetical protein [Actinoplanes sp. RD1]|uniref:hypothetical protein n=1 Tax=Actinoplanes sp. RD1 TaxID=3064538 RepID=UPI0027417965|nr:hypothetical protein [Actinoplanes sp. RD1]
MISRRTAITAAVVALTVVAATTVLLHTRLFSGGGPGEVPAVLASEVSAQVTPLVEQHISAAWSGDRIGCATRVFGVEPAAARTPADVRTAYVWAQCTTIGTGIDSGTVLPAAVRLGPAPSVDTPQDGSYAADVERIFPPRLRDLAYGDTRPDLSAAVAARVAALD